MTLNEWRDAVHELALSKGWYDCQHCGGSPMGQPHGCQVCGNRGTHRNTAELIALVHSELSEALEALRDGHEPYSDAVSEELADVVIRTLDICGYYGIDIAASVSAKHDKNKLRPRRHNKAF